ncbi:molecular chaperone Skp [Pelosinus sp. sgz500959]|uniref:molecular chaperone Skp n=1 Tax=Pelosinus sp. sgz500959 TaxID=3242472 RepID=UPI003671562D
MMLVLALFTAGCGAKPTQDTKVQTPQVGIIDMTKAIKGHPKYNQLMDLTKQADTIAGQLEAQQLAAMQQVQLSPEISQSEMEELSKVLEQEFNSKMSAKQEELSPRINAKADYVRQTLSAEMDAYNDQIEKEYDPQILNLQLKLKTVQSTKEETAALQADLEKLQAQRSEALAAKQKELVARMDELVSVEKNAVEQELGVYAKQLNEDLAKQAGVKQAEIAARSNQKQQLAVQSDQGLSELQQQLVMKKKEIEALQEFMLANITEKTAAVGTEGHYDVVLTNVAVNVSGVDITTKVITECNK